MSQASIRIPAPLRSLTGDADTVEVQGQTVADLLRDLGEKHQGLTERILNDDGTLRTFVNVYLGDSNIRTLDGLDTEVPDDAVLHIIPAVAGGGS